MKKPLKMTASRNCYKCKSCRDVPGDAHKSCANKKAKVTADQVGIANGWFWWPVNFDPIWLKTCTGFEKIETKKKCATRS